MHETEPFSYAAVGGTQKDSPAGYRVDHNRILIGYGLDRFEAAKGAIDDWKMLDLDWTELFPTRRSVQVGTAVAGVVRHLGFWSVNISRLIYVIAEPSRYGFAYGTLACHAEEGEERFLVAHDPNTDEVWYDFVGFSKPKPGLGRIRFPIRQILPERIPAQSLGANEATVDR